MTVLQVALGVQVIVEALCLLGGGRLTGHTIEVRPVEPTISTLRTLPSREAGPFG
jgi:hypothetical protein